MLIGPGPGTFIVAFPVSQTEFSFTFKMQMLVSLHPHTNAKTDATSTVIDFKLGYVFIVAGMLPPKKAST